MANIFERVIDVLNKPLPGTAPKKKDESKEAPPPEQKQAPDIHTELAKREREARERAAEANDDQVKDELIKARRELRNLRLEYEREMAKQAKTHEEVESTTYTVVGGDTLWAIANRYYGNGAEWRRIYEANRDKIENPNMIYPGQTFVIPDDDD